MHRRHRLGWFVIFASACAGSAPPVAWLDDLEAAKARCGPDELIVVQFTAPGRPEREAMVRQTFGSTEVRRVLAEHHAVRLDASTHRRLYRDIFDAGAGLATCVMTADGLCLAAHRGFLTAAELVEFVRRAESAGPIIARLAADQSGLLVRGRRDAPCRATFLLAEAYLAGGNPFAAFRCFTLVTLLATPGMEGQSRVLRACERLARIEIERGNHRESREWLDHLRDRNPERTVHRDEIRLTEAMIAMAERRVTDAHAILTRLRADPTHREFDRVLLEYGRACRQSGREDDARRAFDAIVDDHPLSSSRPAALLELRQFDDPEHIRSDSPGIKR